jgi:CDP-glucose 4,6-dehydratase
VEDLTVENFWFDKRVLVTGATGMVGSSLTQRLVDHGAHVVALVRDLDPQSELVRDGTVRRTSVVNGALEDFRSVERAINEHEVDTVFHLAAQTIVGSAQRSPMATFESNIQGTWHVLEAARLMGDVVQRVVVASSDKAYGEQPDLPYREDHPLAGRAPYEVSKSCTDLITQSYRLTYGVPAAIARCGNIYGPGDLNWSRIVPGTIRSLLRGEQPVLRSDGSFLRDYLYVADVADAYLFLAEAISAGKDLQGGDFNFSDESPRSVWDIYHATCSALGMGGTQPAVLNKASGEIKDQYLSASKARELLGWKAKWSLEDGLERTVEWYRDLLGAAPKAPAVGSPGDDPR